MYVANILFPHLLPIEGTRGGRHLGSQGSTGVRGGGHLGWEAATLAVSPTPPRGGLGKSSTELQIFELATPAMLSTTPVPTSATQTVRR